MGGGEPIEATAKRLRTECLDLGSRPDAVSCGRRCGADARIRAKQHKGDDVAGYTYVERDKTGPMPAEQSLRVGCTCDDICVTRGG